MDSHVKKCTDEVRTYCRPFSTEGTKLERELKRAAKTFDKKEGTLPSEILRAFESYEKHMREKFKEKFKKVERSKPYQTSRDYIKGASIDNPENAEREKASGISSSKDSSAGKEREEHGSIETTLDTKKKALNKLNTGVRGDGKTTPTLLTQGTKLSEKRKALDKLNKGGQKDEATTPLLSKESGNEREETMEIKSPSRDSTSLEYENQRKLKECEEEMNNLKEQLKMLTQEFEIKGETSLDIITGAGRSIKELRTSLESVKKVVFKVPKVKDEDHDVEKTKARIQELHQQEEELSILKDAVLKLDKRKDKEKLTDSKDAIMDKIHELQSLWKKMDTDRDKILEAVLGKEKMQPTVDNILEKLQSLKRNQNDLQVLLKAVSDTDSDLTTKQAIDKVQELKKSVKNQNDTIENQKRLEVEISNKKEELSETKKKCDIIIRKKEEVEQRLTNEIKRLEVEKNHALTRLSEVAGAKLTNENPNITDLSDPNRPIKIAEQFSELYDNTWTDVFEKLTEKCKVSEKEAIQMLLHILEISYQFCAEIASKRYRNILAELTLIGLAVPDENKPKKKAESKEETPKGKKQEIAHTLSSKEITVMQKFFDDPKQAVDTKILKSVLEKIGVSETDMKNMKNLLKITVDGTCHFVEQHVWGKRFEIPAQNDDHLEIAKPYLKKCVRICWLMVAQDPPVFLKTSDKKDSNFDKDLYREFTSCGKKMDYVVWPAIFLHEGGPLLKKGVAQPKS